MKDLVSGFTTPQEVEAAFYSAFAKCDTKAMNAVWAEEKVVCIHPDAQPIFGYDGVTRSWANILNNAELPNMLFNVVNSTVKDSLAIHVVEEQFVIGSDATVVILATNVYQKFEAGWLMIEHHGSSVPVQLEERTMQ
ncbi:MAG: hypothetical protein DHS20C09_05100 [marine bacterium B5-7]|nr:MAG: hypothetical protein DHS20C09_05100 [marine bacterium B5-7]